MDFDSVHCQLCLFYPPPPLITSPISRILRERVGFPLGFGAAAPESRQKRLKWPKPKDSLAKPSLFDSVSRVIDSASMVKSRGRWFRQPRRGFRCRFRRFLCPFDGFILLFESCSFGFEGWTVEAESLPLGVENLHLTPDSVLTGRGGVSLSSIWRRGPGRGGRRSPPARHPCWRSNLLECHREPQPREG